jgi:circadian clock protein KaiC
MTSLLLDESVKVLDKQYGHIASLPFLVDTVILLRYVEVDSSIQRAITVMKMRGSRHQKDIRRFQIRNGGIEIGGPFSGREGVLSGSSYRVS